MLAVDITMVPWTAGCRRGGLGEELVGLVQLDGVEHAAELQSGRVNNKSALRSASREQFGRPHPAESLVDWEWRVLALPRAGAGSLHCGSLHRELAPDRGVIRRPVLRPGLLVDLAGGGPIRRLRRQQQVIDPQSFITMPAPSLIIPERVAVRLQVKDAVGVGQSEIEQRAKA